MKKKLNTWYHNITTYSFYALLAVGVFAIPVALLTWKFNECTKVGHGTFYCVFNMLAG